MFHSVQLSATNTATPGLAALLKRAGETAKLNAQVARSAATMTKNHILLKAGLVRHKTAQRLGGTPTNYLMKAGQSIISRADGNTGQVVILENTAIFPRASGPVTIRVGMSFGPVAPDGRGGTGKQWMPIANVGAAYGRKPREFKDLVFMHKKGSDVARLVRVPKYEKKSDGKRRTKAEAASYRAELNAKSVVFYWLKKQVTLPADPGLLPNAQAFALAAKVGVRDYFAEQGGAVA